MYATVEQKRSCKLNTLKTQFLHFQLQVGREEKTLTHVDKCADTNRHVGVSLKNSLDVVPIENQKVLHELEVGEAIVRLVVKELQVLLMYNRLHWFRDGCRALESLCAAPTRESES